ncbi:unannotated protein [freshwater metagenome]|uniref:Unannotated protein n=1 Tax=freshwater metagenome TaxID=449393 RepID=A0A6J7QUW4_9ZZZZ
MVVLRRPQRTTGLSRVDPPYPLYPYETVLAEQEWSVLSGEADPTAVLQAAFTSAVVTDGIVVPTLQSVAEVDPSGSAKKNSTYAGHGIHRYKGKFYPQLAKSLVNVTGARQRVGVVLDPFGGSGTVALESSLAGLKSVSLDINPVAIAAATAKQSLLQVTSDDLHRALCCADRAVDRFQGQTDWSQFSPDCLDELQSWFPPPALAKLSVLLKVARSTAVSRACPDGRTILEVLISDLTRECSQQEPSDLRIRRRAVPIDDADVFGLFSARASRLLERHRAFGPRLALRDHLPRATILDASASDSSSFTHEAFEHGVSAVVSSPPYGTALPYIDTDRLSIAAVFGRTRRQRTQLEASLVGSREITGRETAEWEALLGSPGAVNLPATTTSYLDALYRAVSADSSAGFRKLRTPALLLRYFVQMNAVLSNVAKVLVPKGEVALVLGDSTTTIAGQKWLIPTVDEVASISKGLGWSLVDDLPITVTQEGLLNARHAITANRVIRFQAD